MSSNDGGREGLYTKIGAIAAVVGVVVGVVAVAFGTAGGKSDGESVSAATLRPTTSSPGGDSTNTPSTSNPTSSTARPTPEPAEGTSEPTAENLYYLTDLQNVEGSNPYHGVISINGNQYARSIYQIGNESRPIETQYDLKRKCETLEFVAGITDDSSEKYVSRFEIYGDNKLLKSFQLGYGEEARHTLDVRGVLRLKVGNSILQRTNAFYRAGWGDAAVLCSGPLE